MFASVAPLFLASLALAGPVKRSFSPFELSSFSNVVVEENFTPFSFNNWNGFSELNNFDNFFGIDNFSGLNNNQIFINQNEVCNSQSVSLVQQQLAIISELTKQVLLTQLCEVEVQTIVFQQFSSGLDGFLDSLLRQGNFDVGFDSSIAALAQEFFSQSGSFNQNGFGFNGVDIGRNSVSVQSNWNDNSSPQSVQNALSQAQRASINEVKDKNSSDSSNNSSDNTAQKNGSSD